MTLAALSQFSDDKSEETIDEELTIPDLNLILNTSIENIKIFDKKFVGNMAMAMAPAMNVINTNAIPTIKSHTKTFEECDRFFLGDFKKPFIFEDYSRMLIIKFNLNYRNIETNFKMVI